ncbi:MAG: hypothetical protein ABSG86_08255 [Thermoguttaceae bacterium]|jgi:hypothetical protein
MIAHARKSEARRPVSPLVRARQLVATRLLPPRRPGRSARRPAVRLALLAAGLAAAAAIIYLAYQAGLLG